MTSSSHSSSENPIVVRNRHFSLFPTLLSQIPRKGRRIGDGHVSESKSADSTESEGLDELDALRAEHALSSTAMGAAARARERLDEESTLRSGIRRERRMRISEMTERVSGMQGAMRKANEILFEEQLQQIEADLRDELEDELERLEKESLEREERLLREEMLHRLRREENRLRDQLDLERDRRTEAHSSRTRERLREEMEVEFTRRKAFLEERLELEANQGMERMERRVEMDLREAMESEVHRKSEAFRLEQEIKMRDSIAKKRRKYETKMEKQLESERESLEKELKSDISVRTKALQEESERAAIGDLDRRFRAEKESMEAALGLRRQELALEREVEMEQRVADFVKQRESEMMSNLEKQMSKRGDMSKKDIKEMLKTMEAEIRLKMETALLDARHRVMEQSGS